MATTLPPYSLIRASTPPELAKIFLHATSLSANAVSEHLLSGVVQGSISPSAFRVWLGVSRSPIAIKVALQQDQSVAVRDAGIKQFGKNLKSARWKETWDKLGGVEGLLEFFSDLSIFEIKGVRRTIIRSVKGSGRAEKADRVFQLLNSLLPGFFDGQAGSQNPDKRPLTEVYKGLVRMCPPKVVERLLRNADGGLNDLFLLENMAQKQVDVLRPFVLRAIFDKETTWNIQDDPSLLIGFLQKWPSAAGHEPNLSASMQFSLDLLRRLASSERSLFPDELFIKELVEPLVRRCRRRKADWTQVLEIVKLTADYLSRYPKAAVHLSFSSDRLIQWVTQSWSRHPTEFEGPLKDLIRHTGKDVGLSSFRFSRIKTKQRYPLLRLGFLATGQGNLDNDHDLKRMDLVWSFRTFELLETEHAWTLYKRLRTQKETFLQSGSQPWQNLSETPHHGDPDVLLSSLLQRRGDEAETVELGTRRLEDHKRKAMSSKEQTVRALHASGAMNWAAESGSLKLYKETHLWARRFIRDPLTVPALYQNYGSNADSLLVGSPRDLRQGVHTVSDLRSRIVDANEILWVLMESLFAGLREPSFNLSFWSGTLDIFNEMVHQRQSYSKSLADLFSDDEIYEIIWEDTLSLLIKAEKAVLQPGHERLQRNSVNSILGGRWGGKVEKELPSTYRFFDELAKARDDIWQSFRPTVLPAAASIPAPYPRGLAIQHLTGPFRMSSSSPDALTPYIAARARQLLFLDAATAFAPYPEDEETKAAIGKFVDCYQTALLIHVPPSLNGEEKRERVEKVWSHAVGPLSEGRMSSVEAFRYWRSRTLFDRVKFWPNETAVSPDQPEKPTFDPRIPQVEDPSEVVEWNPLPPKMEPIKPRELKLTYIDVSKSLEGQDSGRYTFADTRLREIRPSVPGVPEDQLYTCLSVSTDNQLDAKIISRLLLLDSKNTARNRILTSPFPSAEDVRYPRIYLDENYLSKEKGNAGWILADLKTSALFIPPPLLLRLTQDSLEAVGNPALSSNASIEVEGIAFGLVNLLGQSDRPSLASELAIRTIIDRPDASSWHRQLLSPTLLRRLSATQSRACITAFATSIISKMEVKQEDGNASTEKTVKVTTVKHLAQLLHQADYVPQEFSISILQRLLCKATHPDIRTAVLESLLSMLSATDASVNEQVLAALESIIPIAGSLNGRTEIAEEAWQVAEQNLEPPEIPGHHFENNLPPMLAGITRFVAGHRNEPSHKPPWRKEIMRHVVLPIVELLATSTARWLNIFLHKHHSITQNLRVEDLPAVPLNRWVWKAMLESGTAFLPATLLEDSVDFELFNIAPPASIAHLNQTIREDPVLRTTPDCRHFLSLFDNGPSILAGGYNPFWLLSKSFAPPPPAVPHGITVPVAQAQLLRQFDTLLTLDDTTYAHLDAFTAPFEPATWATDDDTWALNRRPLVEEMISRIESLRTEAWRKDPARKPAVLPDTFAMQLWLLPYPGLLPGPESQEGKCEAFAAALAAVLERICSDGARAYHRRFEQVKCKIRKRVGASEDRCLVALDLGEVSSEPQLAELLRVELADALLSGAEGGKDEEMRRRVGEMGKAWVGSFDEEVRRLGCGVVRRWVDV